MQFSDNIKWYEMIKGSFLIFMVLVKLCLICVHRSENAFPDILIFRSNSVFIAQYWNTTKAINILNLQGLVDTKSSR